MYFPFFFVCAASRHNHVESARAQQMVGRVLALLLLLLLLLHAVGSAAPPRFGKPCFDATSGSWVVNVSAP